MTVDEIPGFLSVRVPNLGHEIENEVARLRSELGPEAPLHDAVLGNVVVQQVSKLLTSDSASGHETLRLLFAALDELLADPNPNIADAIYVSFCDELASDRPLWMRARQYMGARLKSEVR